MLKSIFAAVASALRSVGRAVFGIAVAPEVSQEVDDVPAMPAPDYRLIYEQLALDVMQWCCDSLVAGVQAPMVVSYDLGKYRIVIVRR